MLIQWSCSKNVHEHIYMKDGFVNLCIKLSPVRPLTKGTMQCSRASAEIKSNKQTNKQTKKKNKTNKQRVKQPTPTPKTQATTKKTKLNGVTRMTQQWNSRAWIYLLSMAWCALYIVFYPNDWGQNSPSPVSPTWKRHTTNKWAECLNFHEMLTRLPHIKWILLGLLNKLSACGTLFCLPYRLIPTETDLCFAFHFCLFNKLVIESSRCVGIFPGRVTLVT